MQDLEGARMGRKRLVAGALASALIAAALVFGGGVASGMLGWEPGAAPGDDAGQTAGPNGQDAGDGLSDAPPDSLRLVVGSPSSIRPGEDVLSEGGGVVVLGFDSAEEMESARSFYEGNSGFAVADGSLVIADGQEAPVEGEAPAGDLAGLSGSFPDPDDVRSSGKVALIDTGVADGMGIEQVSVIGGGPGDAHGHGTAMANHMRAVYPDVEIVSIKAVGDDGVASASAVYAAIMKARELGCGYINISLSAKAMESNRIVADAIRDAVDGGVTVVGAAGNNGKDAAGYVPGGVDEAVVVGSCDAAETIIPTSNYGDTVDLYVLSQYTSEASAKVVALLASKGEHVPALDFSKVVDEAGDTGIGICAMSPARFGEYYGMEDMINEDGDFRVALLPIEGLEDLSLRPSLALENFAADSTSNGVSYGKKGVLGEVIVDNAAHVARTYTSSTYSRSYQWKATRHTDLGTNVYSFKNLSSGRYLSAALVSSSSMSSQVSLSSGLDDSCYWYVGFAYGTPPNHYGSTDGGGYDPIIVLRPRKLIDTYHNGHTMCSVNGQVLASPGSNDSNTTYLWRVKFNGVYLKWYSNPNMDGSGHLASYDRTPYLDHAANSGYGATVPANPSNGSWTFGGWSRNADGSGTVYSFSPGNVATNTVAPNLIRLEDIKYYAVWKSSQSVKYRMQKTDGSYDNNVVEDGPSGTYIKNSSISYSKAQTTTHQAKSGSVTASSPNYTHYVDVPRRSYSININMRDPSGTEHSGDSGAGTFSAWYGSGSWKTGQYNESVSSLLAGNELRIKDISPATGTHVSNVTGQDGYSSGYYYAAVTSNRTIDIYTAYNTYTVAYNANGGNGAPSSQSATYNSNVTLSGTKPTWANHTFLGWSTSSSATSASYSAGQTVTKPNWTSTQNGTVTLYAVWQATGTVNYYQGQASSTSGLPSSQTKNYGSSVTISTNGMSKSDTTANSHTVSYNQGLATGGYSTSAYATQTSVNTTRYTANGWTTSSSAFNRRDYANGSSWSVPAAGGTLSLYPNFTTSVSNGGVTLRTNNMTKSSISSGNYTVTCNATANGGTASSGSFTCARTTSYTANGWATSSTATSRSYANGVSTGALSGNLTLYPFFSATTTTAAGTLPSASKTGYDFNGWYTAASGGSRVGGAGDSYTPSGNTTIYAQFSPRQGTVNYYQGQASSTSGLPSSQTGNYGSSVTISTNSMSKSDTTANSHTVSYNQGLATAGYSTSTYATQTSVNTTRYTANGWTTSSSAFNRCDYANGSSWSVPAAGGSLSLYPNFTTSVSNGGVTLRTNNMTKSPVSSGSYTVTCNATANGGTASSDSFTCARTTSYTANGWATSSTATSRSYANGVSTGALSGNLTLYPFFSATTTTAAGTLPSASKTGYDFNGWYTAQTGGQLVGREGSSYTPSGNATIYAQFSPRQYSVSYALAGGSHGSSHPETATYDVQFTVSNPTRTGYTFTGWTITGMDSVTHTIGSSTTTSTSLTTPTKATTFKNLRSTSGTVTFTANWSANTVKLTLDNQSATSAGTPAVWYVFDTERYYDDAGKTTVISSISNPAKTGYIFGGYYTGRDGSGTQYIDSNGGFANAPYKNISADTVLYAKWTPITYTVEYYDGTSKYPQTSSHVYDTAKNLLTISALGGSRSGFSFAGWATADKSCERAYSDGQSVTNLTTVNNAVIKLYAVWQRNATFYSGENRATAKTAIQYCNDGAYSTAIPEAPASLSSKSYSTLGWRADSSPAAAQFPQTGTLTVPDTEFFAVYNREATFYSGLARARTEAAAQWCNSAGTYSLNSPAPMAIDGWDARGWRDDGSAAEPEYGSAEAQNLDGGYGPVFYAVYLRVVTITYNGNNSTSGTTADTQAVQYYNSFPGTSTPAFTLAQNGFARTGYTFSSWDIGAPGSSYTGFKPEATDSATTKVASAQWDANEYNLSYDLDDSDGSTSALISSVPPSATYDEAFEVPNPTREGYAFGGWTVIGMDSTAHICGGVPTSGERADGVSGTVFNNLTSIDGATVSFKANWTPKSYNLSYDLNKGTGSTEPSASGLPPSAAFDTAFTVPNPTRTGYDFAGWNIAGMDSCTHVYGGDTTTASSISQTKATGFNNLTSVEGATVSFTATWTPREYAVSYDLNDRDGTTRASCPITTGQAAFDQPVIATNPTRTGYLFRGWDISGLSGDCVHDRGTSASYGTSTTGTAMSGSFDTYYRNLRSAPGTVEFKAVWDAAGYTFHFDANAPSRGTTSGEMPDQEFRFDEPQRITPVGFSNPYYDFAGWSTSPTGGATTFADNQEVSNLTSIDGAEYTLYAQWKPKPIVSVSKRIDGNTTVNVNERVHYIVTATQTVPGADTDRITVSDSLAAAGDDMHARGARYIEDSLSVKGPDGTVLGSGWSADWSADGTAFSVAVDGSFARGDSVTVEYDVLAGETGSTGLQGKTWTNVAGATCANWPEPEPVPASRASFDVRTPSLTISQDVDDGLVDAGDTVTYTMMTRQTVEDARAYDARIVQAFPASMIAGGASVDLDGITASMHTVYGDEDISGSVTKTWDAASNTLTVRANDELSSFSSFTITVPVHLGDRGNSLSGNAYITEAWGAADNAESGKLQEELNVTDPEITASKTPSHASLNTSEVNGYTLTATNSTAGSIAYNISFEDSLSADAFANGAYIDKDSLAVSSPSGQDITASASIAWTEQSGRASGFAIQTNANLALGETITVTYDVVAGTTASTALQDSSITNSATMTASNSTATAEKSGTVRVYTPTLAIEKTADTDLANISQPVAYTIRIWQTVEDAVAWNVTVEDGVDPEMIAAGASYDRTSLVVKDQLGNAVDGCEATWQDAGFSLKTPVSLRGQDPMTVEYTMNYGTATDAGLQGKRWRNTATAYADNTRGPVSDDAEVSVPVPAIDISKRFSPQVANVGQSVDYTLTVTEIVPRAIAYDIALNDSITPELHGAGAYYDPDSLSIEKNGQVLADGFDATFTGDGLSFSSDIDLDDDDVLVIRYRIVLGETTSTGLQGKTLSNETTASTGNTAPATADGTGVYIPVPALSAAKSADDVLVDAGDTVVYTLTATNTGEDGSVLWNTVLTDTMPAEWVAQGGEVDTSAITVRDGSGADVDLNSLTWSGNVLEISTSGALAKGETITASVPMKFGGRTTAMNGKSYTNELVAGADNAGSDSDEATVSVSQPVLSMSKEISATKINTSESARVTVVVENDGNGSVAYGTVLSESISGPCAGAGAYIDEDGIRMQWLDGTGIPASALSCKRDGAGRVVGFSVRGLDVPDGTGFRVSYDLVAGEKSSTALFETGIADDLSAEALNFAPAVRGGNDVGVYEPVAAVEKTAGTDVANVGDSVGYTLKVYNRAAGSVMWDVVVEDAIGTGSVAAGARYDAASFRVRQPDGADITSAATTQITFLGTDEGAFRISTGCALAAGEPLVVEYRVVYGTNDSTGLQGKHLQNTMSAKGANTPAAVGGGTSVYVPRPALDVTASLDKEFYNAGETAYLTITAKSVGEDGSIVRDPSFSATVPQALLDNGGTIVASGITSALDSAPSAASPRVEGNEVIVDSAEDIPKGSSIAVVVPIQLGGRSSGSLAGSYELVAGVSTGNAGSQEVRLPAFEVKQPVLEIGKTANASTVNVSDTVHFTVVLRNTSEGSLAYDPVITDALSDAGIAGKARIVKDSLAAKDAAGADLSSRMAVTWSEVDGLAVGYSAAFALDLAAGDEITVEYDVVAGDKSSVNLVESGFENTVSATASNGLAGSDATAKISFYSPYLTVVKTASATHANAGDTVHYTIEVRQSVEGAKTWNLMVEDEMNPAAAQAGAHIVKDSIALSFNGQQATPASVAWKGDPAYGFTMATGLDIAYGDEVLIAYDVKLGDDSSAALSGTALTNAVRAWGDNVSPDTVFADESSVDIAQPSLGARKSVDKPSVTACDTARYTVAVTEQDEEAVAHGIVVNEKVAWVGDADAIDAGKIAGTLRLRTGKGDRAVPSSAVSIETSYMEAGDVPGAASSGDAVAAAEQKYVEESGYGIGMIELSVDTGESLAFGEQLELSYDVEFGSAGSGLATQVISNTSLASASNGAKADAAADVSLSIADLALTKEVDDANATYPVYTVVVLQPTEGAVAREPVLKDRLTITSVESGMALNPDISVRDSRGADVTDQSAIEQVLADDGRIIGYDLQLPSMRFQDRYTITYTGDASKVSGTADIGNSVSVINMNRVGGVASEMCDYTYSPPEERQSAVAVQATGDGALPWILAGLLTASLAAAALAGVRRRKNR